SAPWVTSGSSPASLTTPALAESFPSRCVANAKLGRLPLGRLISTGSGNSPLSSAVYAAVAAAVAQAPVVQPRRNCSFIPQDYPPDEQRTDTGRHIPGTCVCCDTVHRWLPRDLLARGPGQRTTTARRGST